VRNFGGGQVQEVEKFLVVLTLVVFPHPRPTFDRLREGLSEGGRRTTSPPAPLRARRGENEVLVRGRGENKALVRGRGESKVLVRERGEGEAAKRPCRAYDLLGLT
jgi:hypothetical protein